MMRHFLLVCGLAFAIQTDVLAVVAENVTTVEIPFPGTGGEDYGRSVETRTLELVDKMLEQHADGVVMPFPVRLLLENCRSAMERKWREATGGAAGWFPPLAERKELALGFLGEGRYGRLSDGFMYFLRQPHPAVDVRVVSLRFLGAVLADDRVTDDLRAMLRETGVDPVAELDAGNLPGDDAFALLEALAYLGDMPAEAALRRIVANRDAPAAQRTRTIETLARVLKREDALPLVEICLDGSTPTLASTAFELFRLMQEPYAPSVVGAAVRLYRESAIQAVAGTAGDRAHRMFMLQLVNTLSDAAQQERLDPGMADELATLSRDVLERSAGEYRSYAASLFARVARPGEDADCVVSLLKDENATVRQRMAWALAQKRLATLRKESLAKLGGLLADPDARVRMAAVYALRRERGDRRLSSEIGAKELDEQTTGLLAWLREQGVEPDAKAETETQAEAQDHAVDVP